MVHCWPLLQARFEGHPLKIGIAGERSRALDDFGGQQEFQASSCSGAASFGKCKGPAFVRLFGDVFGAVRNNGFRPRFRGSHRIHLSPRTIEALRREAARAREMGRGASPGRGRPCGICSSPRSPSSPSGAKRATTPPLDSRAEPSAKRGARPPPPACLPANPTARPWPKKLWLTKRAFADILFRSPPSLLPLFIPSSSPSFIRPDRHAHMHTYGRACAQVMPHICYGVNQRSEIIFVPPHGVANTWPKSGQSGSSSGPFQAIYLAPTSAEFGPSLADVCQCWSTLTIVGPSAVEIGPHLVEFVYFLVEACPLAVEFGRCLAKSGKIGPIVVDSGPSVFDSGTSNCALMWSDCPSKFPLFAQFRRTPTQIRPNFGDVDRSSSDIQSTLRLKRTHRFRVKCRSSRGSRAPGAQPPSCLRCRTWSCRDPIIDSNLWHVQMKGAPPHFHPSLRWNGQAASSNGARDFRASSSVGRVQAKSKPKGGSIPGQHWPIAGQFWPSSANVGPSLLGFGPNLADAGKLADVGANLADFGPNFVDPGQMLAAADRCFHHFGAHPKFSQSRAVLTQLRPPTASIRPDLGRPELGTTRPAFPRFAWPSRSRSQSSAPVRQTHNKSRIGRNTSCRPRSQ